MFRSALSLVISLQLAASSFAADLNSDRYVFRYKQGVTQQIIVDDDWASKTITASFVGGVGIALQEKLPLKPEWEDDRWQVEVGTLPAGISFNSTTLSFEGTPSAVTSGQKVTLYGYDTNGERIARANVTFDIYILPENSVKVDLYAHTDRYYNTTINLPSNVTVDEWKEIKTPPPGIDYNGRYVDGTPSKAGQYSILNIGYSYNGEAIVSYYGNILIEEGPTFPTLADRLGAIHQQYGFVWWEDVAQGKIVRAVKDASKVRYSYELKPGEVMPGTLRFNNNPYDLRLNGEVYDYYDQATVRLKAEDTDGATGYSNWFQIGSLGPVGICTPGGNQNFIQLNGTVAKNFYTNGYRVPTAADSNVKAFSIQAGSLPNGLSLDPSTGLISGAPVVNGKSDGVMIRVDFPNNANSTPVICGPYNFTVGAADFALEMAGAKSQYRVGDNVDVTLTATGAAGGLIAPYDISMEESNFPGTLTFDPTTGKLSGAVNEPGQYSAKFVLTNGDGVTKVRGLWLSVHDNLKVNDVPAVVDIKQYNTRDTMFSVSYDQSTIIGAARVELRDGPLPKGIVFNNGSLVVGGGTTLPEGPYGPFFFRLSDSSGQFVDTNPFRFEITQRDDIVAGDTENPVTFSVNLWNKVKPFSVSQPELASGYLPLEYKLTGPQLPDGLVFNDTDGTIVGTPKKKETLTGYTIQIDEISPANLSKVSETFNIVVSDPPAIGSITVGQLIGNKDGTAITSIDPKAALSQPEVARKLVGGVAAVTYLAATPDIPGLTFVPATGQITGVPTGEYAGNVSIQFKDGGERLGTVVVPTRIHPYPAITTEQAFYEVPRLTDAANLDIIVKAANSGFYQGIAKFELAPNSDPWPANLSLSAGGKVTGQTNEPVDTTRNMIIRATSAANGLTADHAFTIKITPRTEPNLNIPDTTFKIWMDEQTGDVVRRDEVISSTYLKGSYVKPVVYTLGPDAPAWLTINPTTGTLGGVPTAFKDWQATIIATDAENATASDTVNLNSTLNGSVVMTPGGASVTVRAGETFETNTQTITNVVRPSEFVATQMPTSLTLDQPSGKIRGLIDNAGDYSWTLNVKDAQGRWLASPASFGAKVVPPLALPNVTKNPIAKQYDIERPLDIQFQKAQNVMGDVGYVIEGNVPGTLYYQVTDPNTHLLSFYQYDGALYQGRVDQQPNETFEQVVNRLALDALIFDAEEMTLKGTPSGEGTFTFTLVALDDHADAYLDQSDPTRVEHNKAKRVVTVTVEKADKLEIANSANAETLHQYTSTPTLRTTVAKTAYGRGVTWTKVSGALPTNVSESKGTFAISYAGYPESQGNYPNIVWRAQDAAGRTINSDAVAFTVGPRQTMELVTSAANPRYMIVFDQDAGMTVSAKNAAYGPNIGASRWTVSGDSNLPPGVTYTINDAGVQFTGTSDVIGVYEGIRVTGTDRLGASASVDLKFNVVSNPGPIELTVFDIVTKPGYPVEMDAPFTLGQLSTANTYGKIRFYSYDLPSELNLAEANGDINGSFPSPRDVSFDLYVTDDTNRVTSKPVNVAIVPFLRIIVPTQVDATQGSALLQTTSTDYALGAVRYEKGTGNWPVGIDVNPTTGAIVSSGVVTAAAGTYSDLTIRGFDTFGIHTDTQLSSAFSIVIESTRAEPDIANPSKTILGIEGTKIVDWLPTVVEKSTTTRWNYGGTTYTTSHNLENYGLDFDPSTGVISGTPTKPFIIRNFSITVTSARGDADTTAPFWIGVAPKDNLVMSAGQTIAYSVRKGDALLIPALAWDNLFEGATVSYTTTGGGSDVTVSATGELTNVTSTSGWTARNDIEIKRTIIDEFNRTATGSIFLNVLQGLSISAATSDIFLDDQTTFPVQTVTNVYGTASYAASDLPTGLSIDPVTGVISGSLSSSIYAAGITFDIPVTVRDSHDGAQKTGVYQITTKATSTFKDLSTSITHACGVTTAGAATCWGSNGNGQLGDNSLSSSNKQVKVSGLTSGVQQISVGIGFSCAINSNGGVVCWGQNSKGQLGTGNTAQSLVPVQVSGLASGVSSISVGEEHGCAVMNDRTLKCWGSNQYGAVGNNSTATVTSPVTIDVGTSYREVSSGRWHSCGVTTGGVVKCWGNNASAQLGDGTTTLKRTPVIISGISNPSSISAGYSHTCGVLQNGSAMCWGYNGDYAIGNGTTTRATTPTAVTLLSEPVRSIKTGFQNTCVITNGNNVKCWGSNKYGELGHGTTGGNEATPSLTSDASQYSSVFPSPIANYVCGITIGGEGKCWGFNDSGRLGIGNNGHAYSPTKIQ
jgi:alpha-tubulin suppressor-like RCC1 family protein